MSADFDHTSNFDDEGRHWNENVLNKSTDSFNNPNSFGCSLRPSGVINAR